MWRRLGTSNCTGNGHVLRSQSSPKAAETYRERKALSLRASHRSLRLSPHHLTQPISYDCAFTCYSCVQAGENHRHYKATRNPGPEQEDALLRKDKADDLNSVDEVVFDTSHYILLRNACYHERTCSKNTVIAIAAQSSIVLINLFVRNADDLCGMIYTFATTAPSRTQSQWASLEYG